jgi:hypothetical protein
MAREPLDTLLRLRRLEVQDRIRALATAIRAEESAHLARTACAEAIARETAAARSLAECDATLASFAAWRAPRLAMHAARCVPWNSHWNDASSPPNRRRSDRRSTR